jgi:hypothetical protein
MRDEGSTPFWTMFLVWTLPLVALQVVSIICWNWVVDKAIESTDDDYPTTMMPVAYGLVLTLFGFCGMSQIPLILFVTGCWLGP